MTLLLPWFPILLGVGLAGRLLGCRGGLFVGILCALFWIMLVQASEGPSVWREGWVIAALAAGSAAIAAMGAWSGQNAAPAISGTSAGQSAPDRPDQTSSRTVFSNSAGSLCDESPDALHRIATTIRLFDDWLSEHREDRNPWIGFDEFLRAAMYRCCEATHVRPYRLCSEGKELAPLREPDAFVEVERLSARRGIIGHVVTTGRSYVSGDTAQGELLDKLAEESGEAPAWVFAVRQGTRRLGVVTTGQLGIPPGRNKALLCAVERLVGQFWRTLEDTVRTRCAVQEDPVSGLPTRPAFLQAAEQALHESYQQGEPVAMVVIALEGMRELGDSGRWEIADEVAAEVSRALRRKVRLDDRLGRFDGSRFILLLRRVDSELASLIVRQLLSRVGAVCGNEERWRATIDVRCGVAGSGTENPDLHTLVFRALSQCRRARLHNLPMAADLGSTTAPAESVEV